MSRLPIWLRRWAFRAGHRGLRLYWLLVRPRKHGVKCVLYRGHDVLLVRHTYGERERWELPGGAIKAGEDPRDAATREVDEELGVQIVQWRSVGELFVRLDRRRDTLHCFAAEVGALESHVDEGEIAEIRWFRAAELPDRLGRYVRRILHLAGIPGASS